MKNITNLQSGRLFPTCEENAPQFSNDVYNKRYTREKIASRFQQSGRSMIEMLGVLAIVGVLSVGGIAGYSKAMQKYRTNKTIEQVTQIINGVRTLYSNQKNYASITAYGPNNPLKKAKILPESAWECSDGICDPQNPFGGIYDLWSQARDGTVNTWGKSVRLDLENIPDDACIDLATQDWGAGEGLYAIGINNTDAFDGCSGIKNEGDAVGCVSGSTVALPVPMDDAISACASNNNNIISFFFY